VATTALFELLTLRCYVAFPSLLVVGLVSFVIYDTSLILQRLSF
jgi:hypothetical protein